MTITEYDYFEASYKNNDGTTTHCRYAKNKDGTLGIIPQILTDLQMKDLQLKRE